MPVNEPRFEEIENGIHIETSQDGCRADIEGRINGRSPIRVLLQRGQPPLFEIVTVAAIPWTHAKQFLSLFTAIIETVDTAQKIMDSD